MESTYGQRSLLAPRSRPSKQHRQGGQQRQSGLEMQSWLHGQQGTMTDEELDELAEAILDQWSREIAAPTPPFLQGNLTR